MNLPEQFDEIYYRVYQNGIQDKNRINVKLMLYCENSETSRT